MRVDTSSGVARRREVGLRLGGSCGDPWIGEVGGSEAEVEEEDESTIRDLRGLESAVCCTGLGVEGEDEAGGAPELEDDGGS